LDVFRIAPNSGKVSLQPTILFSDSHFKGAYRGGGGAEYRVAPYPALQAILSFAVFCLHKLQTAHDTTPAPFYKIDRPSSTPTGKDKGRTMLYSDPFFSADYPIRH